MKLNIPPGTCTVDAMRNIAVLVFVAAAAMLAGCSGPITSDGASRSRSDQPLYQCRRAGGPITIDGSLDDPAWQDAPFSDLFFVSARGVRQMPDKLATRMKLLYDADSLYVAFDCEDGDIWSTFANHDDPVQFEKATLLNIDPLANGRSYVGIYINPLNAMLDLKATSGPPEISRRSWLQAIAWNGAGIEHAVQTRGTVNKRDDLDDRWTVEIRLPFSDLGVKPLPGDTWHIQAGRLDYWLGGNIISGWTRSQFGDLTFR